MPRIFQGHLMSMVLDVQLLGRRKAIALIVEAVLTIEPFPSSILPLVLRTGVSVWTWPDGPPWLRLPALCCWRSSTSILSRLRDCRHDDLWSLGSLIVHVY
jgi:hypothetical protein